MSLIEKIARSLCQQHIRNVRRHDTEPERLEAMLPAAVDYAWPDFEDAAQAVLTELSAGDGVQEVDREAAKWRHGPTCAYHAFADRDCTCGAWEAFARHRTLAAAAERARIVAWLRGGMSQGAKMPKAIADAIERGEV